MRSQVTVIKEVSSSKLGAEASSHLNETGDRTKAAVDNLFMGSAGK